MTHTNRLRMHMGCGESLQSRRWIVRQLPARAGKRQSVPSRRVQTRRGSGVRS